MPISGYASHSCRVVSRKLSPIQVLSFSLLTLSISLLILILPNKSLYLYLVIPFVAISNGLTQPNSTSLVSSLADPKSQGVVLGISQSFQALGFALAPIISGFIVSFNINLPIIIASLCIFLSWMVFVLLFKNKNKELFHEL